MQQIVPFVTESVAAMMGTALHAQFDSKHLVHQHPPLAIASSKEALVSYKAPWHASSCVTALQTTGMHEAGGNLFWINWRPPTGVGSIIAGASPRWAQVKEVADRYFSESALQSVGGARQRIVFPVTLMVHATSLGDVATTTDFASSMDLLVGHVFVWGWMLGMLRALIHHDGPLARALWESALTVTLHMRVALTDANKAALSISESELRKSAAGLLTDSFVGFAAKCAVIFDADPKATNKAKLLAAHNVKYAGAEPTKSMLTVIFCISASGSMPVPSN